MEISIQQAWQGIDLELEAGRGESSKSSATIYYIVAGTTNDADACVATWNFAAETYLGMPRKSVAVAERLTDDSWKIEVRYGNDDASGGGSDDGESTVSFDCGGGSKHLNYAISDKIIKGDKKSGGAINWNGKAGSDMEISGIDIPTAQLRETYTKMMSLSRITTSYKRKVAELVGKVNSSSFKGWSAGEVMFLGMSYSAPDSASQRVAVTFNFLIQPNEKNVKVAGESVSKKGFEYVWAISKSVVDSATNMPKLEVEALYLATVCEEGNFSVLGL